MDKVAVFLDGGYLQKGISEKINHEKLSDLLVGTGNYLRTYYYHAWPYKANHPSQADSDRYANMQRFISALQKIQRYTVRMGKVEWRGVDSKGNKIFQQKRVDILFGCDLVLLSAKRSIGKAILVTGDSDFIPAIEIAKNEGVEVELVYISSCPPSEALLTTVDTHRPLSASEINSLSMKTC